MRRRILFTIVALCLTGTLLSQSFRKGPYLLYPNDNTKMTVLWQLDATAASQISWGTTQSYGNTLTVSEYGADHQFKETLTGLTPATKYYYKVEVGSTVKTGTFNTAPTASEKNLTFYIYGDTRSHPEVQNNVTGRIITEINSNPTSQTFCLITGDCVTHGRVENDWQQQFFNTAYTNNGTLKSMLPYLLARGNHENYNAIYSNGKATVFYKYWPYSFASGSTDGDDMYYSFDYGPVHIAVIDQYDNGSYNPAKLSSTQLSWLQNDLASSDKSWKFILLHEPGWSAKYTSVSREHGNNTDVQQNIQPLCVQYGVQAVFGGHNHYYAHCLVNNVHHFTLGGGGAPLYTPSHTSGGIIVYAEKTYHFMKVKIENNTATLTAIRPDGSVVETTHLIITDIHSNSASDSPVTIFPNPSTNGLFTIKTSGTSLGRIEVLNSLGQQLFTKMANTAKTEIDLTGYGKGIYFVGTTVNGNKLYRKIMVN